MKSEFVLIGQTFSDGGVIDRVSEYSISYISMNGGDEGAQI